MGGYTHKHWAADRHRHSKHTSIQDGIEMSREKFDAAFPERRLTNWEQFELRDFLAEQGKDLPPMEERTLSNFIKTVGRPPTEI